MRSKPYRSWGLAFNCLFKMAKRLYGAAADLLFPENMYCACCGDVIDRKTRIHSLCDNCIEKIQWISDNPYASSMDDFSFDDLFSCCIYGYYPRQMIHKLKFSGARYLAKPMGKLLAERMLLACGGNRERLRASYDCISYIPCTAEKQRSRGYNQAKLLAKYTASELGIPLEDLLIKPVDTPSVRLAGRYERRTMLEGAFSPSPKYLSRDCPAPFSGKRVLLVDDVFTTGSTVNEAALTLKNAGADKIDVLVFACGSGFQNRGDGS